MAKGIMGQLEMRRVQARDGSVAWVKESNVDKWEAEHSSAAQQGLPVAPPPPPPVVVDQPPPRSSVPVLDKHKQSSKTSRGSTVGTLPARPPVATASAPRWPAHAAWCLHLAWPAGGG